MRDGVEENSRVSHGDLEKKKKFERERDFRVRAKQGGIPFLILNLEPMAEITTAVKRSDRKNKPLERIGKLPRRTIPESSPNFHPKSNLMPGWNRN